MSAHREALAALVVRILGERYRSQDFAQAEAEDWTRVCLEGDPIVFLEAAWDWWAQGTQNFRPSPGQLREIAKGWPVSDRPYVLLREALVSSESPGLAALIERYGRKAYSELRGDHLLPSQEERWLGVNLDHRRYVFAKQRMEHRGSVPWNPAEIGQIAVTVPVMAALTSPSVTNELAHDGFRAKLSGLSQSKRLS